MDGQGGMLISRLRDGGEELFRILGKNTSRYGAIKLKVLAKSLVILCNTQTNIGHRKI